MFERHDQKLIVFMFSGHFCELLPTICGFGAIYEAHESRYMFERHDQKISVLYFLIVFVSYCPQFVVSVLMQSP
jgi:hypothetical protein